MYLNQLSITGLSTNCQIFDINISLSHGLVNLIVIPRQRTALKDFINIITANSMQHLYMHHVIDMRFQSEKNLK
jgi:hypothetical protein